MVKKKKSRPQFLLGVLSYLIISGCVSSNIETIHEEANSGTSTWSCDKNISCLPEVSDGVPHMCKIPMVNGGTAVWGSSKCLAEKKLKDKLCAKKVDFESILWVSCIPDPSGGECPTTPGFCTFEYKPSTCRAQKYNGSKLAWNLQPIARGSNSCLAQIRLKKEACYSGLLPSLLEDIVCEDDKTKGLCPPKYKCKSSDDRSTTTCKAEKFGSEVLDPPWSEEASSECEAKFAIYQRACSYANAANGLQPNQLGDIKCN